MYVAMGIWDLGVGVVLSRGVCGWWLVREINYSASLRAHVPCGNGGLNVNSEVLRWCSK
jgi:hypothetical protein